MIETFKRFNGELRFVSGAITDDLDWAIETEVEAHGLGTLLAQSKGESGALLFQHGRINYTKK
jgi:hypothetical protein